MYRYFLILLLAFTSCEYHSEINLSSRLPLTVKLEDHAKIKRLTVEENVSKKSQKNYSLIIEIEHYKEKSTDFINFDYLPSNYKVSLGALSALKFEPNKDYLIYIKTDKGYAWVEFYVDKDENIITLPPYSE